jgi:hypothetical protein
LFIILKNKTKKIFLNRFLRALDVDLLLPLPPRPLTAKRLVVEVAGMSHGRRVGREGFSPTQ